MLQREIGSFYLFFLTFFLNLNSIYFILLFGESSGTRHYL